MLLSDPLVDTFLDAISSICNPINVLTYFRKRLDRAQDSGLQAQFNQVITDLITFYNVGVQQADVAEEALRGNVFKEIADIVKNVLETNMSKSLCIKHY